MTTSETELFAAGMEVGCFPPKTGTEARPDPGWVDSNALSAAIAAHPPEYRARFAGQYVAWTRDGSRVVDSDTDRARLYDRLDRAGISSERVAFEYVPSEGD